MANHAAPLPSHPPAPALRVLVEGGHYSIGATPSADGELLELPDGRRCTAMTTESTQACFATAAREALRLRAHGTPARIGLLVGDLALPGESRPSAGSWALPPSYRTILAEAGLTPEDVSIYGEAYARNQGKRRLLDEVLARSEPPEETYRREGWALFHGDRDEICIASDASLDWEGDVRVAMLARGPTPLCPLIFAGLRRAVFQAGFGIHWAVYAIADDHLIDRKLRAAAAAVAQLRGGRVGAQKDTLFLASQAQPALQRTWELDELVAPGERPWSTFVECVRAHHPQFHPFAAGGPPRA